MIGVTYATAEQKLHDPVYGATLLSLYCEASRLLIGAAPPTYMQWNPATRAGTVHQNGTVILSDKFYCKAQCFLLCS